MRAGNQEDVLDDPHVAIWILPPNTGEFLGQSERCQDFKASISAGVSQGGSHRLQACRWPTLPAEEIRYGVRVEVDGDGPHRNIDNTHGSTRTALAAA